MYFNNIKVLLVRDLYYFLTNKLNENQREIITRLGKNIANGEKLQHIVKAGRWFGAQPAKETEFVLVGCQVSPGFDFRDWEMYE
jgi:predicted cupin superfamily sugar epimerase